MQQLISAKDNCFASIQIIGYLLEGREDDFALCYYFAIVFTVLPAFLEGKGVTGISEIVH